jgi:outer membrane protein insertion porin family
MTPLMLALLLGSPIVPTEGGSVEIGAEKTEETRNGISAGVGMCIPVCNPGPVPIAFDFGFPIVRGPNDREQVFKFWIGLFR